MPTKRDTSHVVWKGSAFVCEHCGDSLELPLPLSIGMAAVMARQYVKEHAGCRKPGTKTKRR